MSYVTIDELELLFRTLNENEKKRASALLPIVESKLRNSADNVGKDLDEMINNDSTGDYLNEVKSVVVDVVARTIMTSTNQEPMTQSSESAMGYSFSGTFLVPGGGVYIKKSELARLGLRKQQLRGIDLC